MIGGVNGGNSLPFFSSVKSDSLLRKSGLVKPLSVGELLSPASIPQSKSLSVGSVERNIDDYNDGGGYFTKSTGKALKGLKFSTGSTLSKLNPSLASTYNLTLAGLTSYGQQSRFINSTAELSTFIERIDRAQQLEGREDEIMELFGYDPETGKKKAVEPAAEDATTSEANVESQPAVRPTLAFAAARYTANAAVVKDL